MELAWLVATVGTGPVVWRVHAVCSITVSSLPITSESNCEAQAQGRRGLHCACPRLSYSLHTSLPGPPTSLTPFAAARLRPPCAMAAYRPRQGPRAQALVQSAGQTQKQREHARKRVDMRAMMDRLHQAEREAEDAKTKAPAAVQFAAFDDGLRLRPRLRSSLPRPLPPPPARRRRVAGTAQLPWSARPRPRPRPPSSRLTSAPTAPRLPHLGGVSCQSVAGGCARSPEGIGDSGDGLELRDLRTADGRRQRTWGSRAAQNDPTRSVSARTARQARGGPGRVTCSTDRVDTNARSYCTSRSLHVSSSSQRAACTTQPEQITTAIDDRACPMPAR